MITCIDSDGIRRIYQWVDVRVSWAEAKTQAESMSYKGETGHLLTITSLEEQKFRTTFSNDRSIDLGTIGGLWTGVSGGSGRTSAK